MEIVLEEVNYIYHKGSPFEHHALHDISMRIPSGIFAAILGPTGSGKSTLIQLIAGLLRPTSGSIRVGDLVITNQMKKLSALRTKVGLVFQYPEHQLFAETVAKDIAFGPINQGLPSDEVNRRVQNAMELVGLPASLAHRSPFLLSGGQMRRVAIAGVLAMEPEIMMFDEPTAGLDPKGRHECLQLIERIQQEKKITVILITHLIDDAAKYGERVYLIHQGRSIVEGTPEKILTHSSLLNEFGLHPPEITQFIQMLNQNLYPPLPNHILNIDDLALALTEHEQQNRKDTSQ